jgi:hypothetical protein
MHIKNPKQDVVTVKILGVTLAGEKCKHCQEANEEEGYVVCYESANEQDPAAPYSLVKRQGTVRVLTEFIR